MADLTPQQTVDLARLSAMVSRKLLFPDELLADGSFSEQHEEREYQKLRDSCREHSPNLVQELDESLEAARGPEKQSPTTLGTASAAPPSAPAGTAASSYDDDMFDADNMAAVNQPPAAKPASAPVPPAPTAPTISPDSAPPPDFVPADPAPTPPIAPTATVPPVPMPPPATAPPPVPPTPPPPIPSRPYGVNPPPPPGAVPTSPPPVPATPPLPPYNPVPVPPPPPPPIIRPIVGPPGPPPPPPLNPYGVNPPPPPPVQGAPTYPHPPVPPWSAPYVPPVPPWSAPYIPPVPGTYPVPGVPIPPIDLTPTPPDTADFSEAIKAFFQTDRLDKKVEGAGRAIEETGRAFDVPALEKFGEMVKVIGLATAGLKDWIKSLEEANFRFADFSGAMAQVRAEQQIRDVILKRERGDRRAEGAESLTKAQHSMNVEFAKAEDRWADSLNKIAEILAEGMMYLVTIYNKYFGSTTPPTPPPTNLTTDFQEITSQQFGRPPNMR